MFLGQTIADSLNIHSLHQLVTKMNESKMQTFVCLWMVNIFGAQMLSTGAFEIYVDDDLVFSKLESGGLPDMHSLRGIVGEAISS